MADSIIIRAVQLEHGGELRFLVNDGAPHGMEIVFSLFGDHAESSIDIWNPWRQTWQTVAIPAPIPS